MEKVQPNTGTIDRNGVPKTASSYWLFIAKCEDKNEPHWVREENGRTITNDLVHVDSNEDHTYKDEYVVKKTFGHVPENDHIL